MHHLISPLGDRHTVWRFLLHITPHLFVSFQMIYNIIYCMIYNRYVCKVLLSLAGGLCACSHCACSKLSPVLPGGSALLLRKGLRQICKAGKCASAMSWEGPSRTV